DRRTRRTQGGAGVHESDHFRSCRRRRQVVGVAAIGSSDLNVAGNGGYYRQLSLIVVYGNSSSLNAIDVKHDISRNRRTGGLARHDLRGQSEKLSVLNRGSRGRERPWREILLGD